MTKKTKGGRPKQNSTKKVRTDSIKEKEQFFSKDDYDSNNGMMTSIWGPPTWHMLHCISFNYPVSPSDLQKKQYMDYIQSLQHILPCGKCRKNLAKNFKRLPLEDRHMASRETFSRYIFDLHEVINEMLGKKSGLAYDIVRDRYEHFRARCAPPSTSSKPSTMLAEKGCVVPYYGKKQKCVLRIVPHTKKCKTFHIQG
jgi:Erv1 / Alr family